MLQCVWIYTLCIIASDFAMGQMDISTGKYVL